MAKHFANIDVKGDLRVRKQIRGGLHVENVVTAEAFYLKSGGEVGTGGGSPLTVTDNTNSYSSVTELNFNSSQFYLSSDLSGNPVVNLETKDFITFQIEHLAQKNYFIDGSAPFPYKLEKVVLRSETGRGNATFYINPEAGTGAGRYGRPITGLIDFYISPIKQTFNVSQTVGPGDEWFMGVIDPTPDAIDVVGIVTLVKGTY